MRVCVSCKHGKMTEADPGIWGVGIILVCPECGMRCTPEWHGANSYHLEPNDSQTTLGLLYTGEKHGQ